MSSSSNSKPVPGSASIRLLAISGVMFLLGVPSAGADATSTFDTGLDGWSGLSSQGPASQYSWGSTGGDPGGYFDFIDQSSTSGTITAPSAFLGNWSALNGKGILSWDQILFSTGPQPGSYGPFEADIAGPGGSATFTSTTGDTVVGSWIAIMAPIVSTDWTINSGTWAALLANVTSLNLAIEDVTNNVTPTMQNPGDHDGIDNVFLGVPSVVPEPGSLMLAGSGLACLLAARVPRGKRDRRQRAHSPRKRESSTCS